MNKMSEQLVSTVLSIFQHMVIYYNYIKQKLGLEDNH